jgi:ribosomal protein S6
MPLYQHIILTLPKASKETLATLMKKYAEIVFAANGVIRGIENHGIRSLPERARRYSLLFQLSCNCIYLL